MTLGLLLSNCTDLKYLFHNNSFQYMYKRLRVIRVGLHHKNKHFPLKRIFNFNTCVVGYYTAPANVSRVAKFKCPRVLGDQEISEDNQELRPGCPPDYQIFCERIDPKMFIPTNLSSYFSLTNKNSSMRTSTSTTYI